MNSIETIEKVCELLEAGHVMEADNAIRKFLATMQPSQEHFETMHKAAQLIWPSDQPKQALAELRAYMDNKGNQEGT